jgi:hypothetical protein
MKVRPTTNASERPPADQPQPAAKRPPSQPISDETASALGASRAAERRDFDSVLKEVSRRPSRAEGREDKSTDESRNEARAPREVERDADGRDEGQESGAGGGALAGRSSLGEPLTLSETTSARAILHIVDLERIVSAVRTQALAGGQREVTIELKRSVLEGLSVKLSSDGAGRVTAEFVAASERVRALVEARSAELADLMRSRGVNLADLRTSVGRHSSDGRGREGREPRQEDAPPSAVGDAPRAAAELPEPGESSGATAETDPAAGGRTYRA